MIYGRCSRLRAVRLNRARRLLDSPSNRCGSMNTAVTFAGQIQSWLADLGDGGGVEDGWRGGVTDCPAVFLMCSQPAFLLVLVCARVCLNAI